MSNPAPSAISPDWPLARAEVRARAAILALAFLALHAEILFRIAWVAWTDGDWSHAFLIPLISAYFVHLSRDRLAAVRYRTFWPGLAVMAAAVAVYFYAVAHALDTVKGYAMIANLFGLTLLLAGPAAMRVLALPILYLAFAVKLPDELWTQIAWHMQIFAARCSVLSLMVLGVDAVVTATTIELWSRTGELIGSLNVAEACSGMRMLMTFLALGVVFAFMSDRSWWARAALVASAVPVALVVNVGRVTVLGLLYLIDPKYARGDFHIFMGMLMLIPAVLLFMLISWAIGLADDRWGRGRRKAAGDARHGGEVAAP